MNGYRQTQGRAGRRRSQNVTSNFLLGIRGSHGYFSSVELYCEPMPNNRTNWNSLFSTPVVRGSQKGVPFVPGVLLIVLGLVVLFAPRLVLATIALCLLVVGGVCCYVAYKLVAFRRQVQALTKTFEGSFQASGFHSRKPDIDITELESKKIIFH